MPILNRTAIAAIFVLLSGLAGGQTNSAPVAGSVRISGRIVDVTGQPISNPKVSLKRAASDAAPVVVHAAPDGAFAFRAEPPGKYQLTAEMPGFLTTVKAIDVGADKEFHAGDIVMPTGDASIVDVVMADTVPLETPDSLTVQGISGRRVILTQSDIAAFRQHTIQTTDHATPATFEGVLLTDLLADVVLRLGEKVHGAEASCYMVAEARDGYRATFAWAELDPTFMDKAVYVVTRRDGRPLSDKDGPFQLVVPGEKRFSRWVRQLTALRFRQAN